MAQRGKRLGGLSGRANRRALKAGAAASIVLTFSPGLVAASSAPAATIRPPVNLRSQTVPVEDDESAKRDFRDQVRGAQRDRARAREQANEVFRRAVAPHRQALAEALEAAESKAQRRDARVQYGEAILAAKIARKTALQDARVTYIENVEQARIDFLKARNAHVHVIAAAGYRQALNVATAEYRAALATAQGVFKAESAPLRSLDRSDRSATGSTDSGDKVRSKPVSRQYATADIAGVFRSQVSSARASYQSKVSLARKNLSGVLAAY